MTQCFSAADPDPTGTPTAAKNATAAAELDQDFSNWLDEALSKGGWPDSPPPASKTGTACLMHIPVKDKTGDKADRYGLTINDSVVHGRKVGRRGNGKCWMLDVRTIL